MKVGYMLSGAGVEPQRNYILCNQEKSTYKTGSKKSQKAMRCSGDEQEVENMGKRLKHVSVGRAHLRHKDLTKYGCRRLCPFQPRRRPSLYSSSHEPLGWCILFCFWDRERGREACKFKRVKFR